MCDPRIPQIFHGPSPGWVHSPGDETTPKVDVVGDEKLWLSSSLERPKSATPTKSNVHMQHGWLAAFAKRVFSV